MAVLVFAEHIEGIFHKPAFEVVTYAYDMAQKLGTEVCAVVIGNVGNDEIKKLGQYGAKRILVAKGDAFTGFDSKTYATAVEQAIQQSGADTMVMSNTFNGRSLAPRLAARLQAGLVTNVVSLPATDNGFVVKKAVYSGKGFGHFRIGTDKKIVTIAINSHHVEQHAVEPSIEELSVNVTPGVKILETHRQKGKVSLTEAEVIVSGGRGMKGPENWNLVEELADILGAATACSKPVSDVGWRPHSEHVGQTGLTVSPDLYIAVGISGAIQHLAGVSSSKVIAVINKDPEAPFFKAADYGIVGDAFDVLPKLIEAAKKVKAS